MPSLPRAGTSMPVNRKSQIGNRAAAIVMTAQRAGGSALSNRTGLIRLATIVEPGIGYDAGRS
jgi:hypothetical protein